MARVKGNDQEREIGKDHGKENEHASGVIV
jgi:hypothetical protein